ncbi:MAG TPA: twin-arginine translocase subunit TatC, partial [Planctomycetaceae bacterium]|nr:twin-arginine translocase subunit TatC [Planctomycetaceae bacterium]
RPDELVAAQSTTGPVNMLELLSKLPDPDQLTPKLQLRRHEIGLSALKIEEPFMIWVKAGLIVGAVIASPMIFYHLWSFVAAGLHSHERKYVYVYLPISIVLFISGVSLAFFFVLDFVISFLLQFNGQLEVAVEPRLTYYINFVLLLPLGFGLAFQLPLVMLFLERIGLIPVEAFVKSWRIAILVIAIISMLVTPADITSMISLMIPLIFLYFLGVLMCMYLPKGRGLGSDAYDPR